MKRDFSEEAYQTLLSLVREVEDEQLCALTDWIGDGWLDFEAWTGELNIKQYVNDVNSYHKKVIDKNDASAEEIRKIFDNVNLISAEYRSLFFKKLCSMNKLRRKFLSVANAISPANGRLRPEYWGEGLRNSLHAIIDHLQDMTAGRKNYLEIDLDKMEAVEFLSEITGTVSCGLLGAMKLRSAILDNLSDEVTEPTADSTTVSESDIALEVLDSGNHVIDSTTKIYGQVQDRIPAPHNKKIYDKFGKTMAWGSAVGSSLKLAKEGIETHETFTSEDASAMKKSAQGAELISSGVDFGSKIYIAAQEGNKSLKYVSGKKQINQILDIPEKKITYTNKALEKKVSKVSTATALLEVTASVYSGGANRLDALSEDGEISAADVNSSVIYACTNGLSAIVGNGTLGAIQVDGNDYARRLEDGITEFYDSDNVVVSWAADYISDKDNNIIARVGVAIPSAVGIFVVETGEMAKDAVVNGFNAASDWISSAWDFFTK